MQANPSTRNSLPWLELMLGLAIVVLLLQVFPAAAIATRDWLDVRHWSATTWFAANAILFLVLFAIRYGTDILPGFSLRHLFSAEKRRKRREALAAAEHRKKLDEERKLYARMHEARKRQI